MTPQSAPVVEGIDIVKARPEHNDVRSLDAIQTRESVSLEPSVWMVVLSLDHVPEPTGSLLRLYLDDYWVQKYWAFSGGIYFKVYNPRFFTKHGGKTFRFVSESGSVYETSQRLPDRAPEQAARRPAALADTARELPSQREVLDQVAQR